MKATRWAWVSQHDENEFDVAGEDTFLTVEDAIANGTGFGSALTQDEVIEQMAAGGLFLALVNVNIKVMSVLRAPIAAQPVLSKECNDCCQRHHRYGGPVCRTCAHYAGEGGRKAREAALKDPPRMSWPDDKPLKSAGHPHDPDQQP